VFHLYRGFNHKVTKLNFFIKGSSKVVEPPKAVYKGFKYNYSLKGDVLRG